MGNKKKSREYYFMVSTSEPEKDSFIRYYKGLALQKTGQKEKAQALFNDMITRAEELLNLQETEVDFFAKYGKKQTDNQRKSTACLLKGLGLKGIGQASQANKMFGQSLEYYCSNLWAKVYMNN